MFFQIINFKKYSSIKIGSSKSVLFLEKGDIFPKNYKIVGKAKNILFSESINSKIAILSKDFSFIYIRNNLLYIGCSTPVGMIISFVKKHNISGFEFLCNLPGSLGGLLAINAGLKEYEIFNIVESLKINGVWKQKKDIQYGYRFVKLNGIVTEASFGIKYGFDQLLIKKFNNMRKNQPKLPNIGSIFKNDPKHFAGKLIEDVGLKGFRKGDMSWSIEHANFLVNHNNGLFKDALFLIKLAQKEVFKKFKVKLKKEIKIF